MGAYADFFSWSTIVATLSDPVSWGVILTLIVMEGLLSADNALVLAAIVQKYLPDKEKQKKALLYGIVGAYIFRFIAIGLGLWLVKIWWIKLIGGGYLLWMAYSFFKEKLSKKEDGDEEEDEQKDTGGIFIRLLGTFWGTVATVELMDIAFSVDSVLAAFGVSNQTWVLFMGGILGVLMMRGVAQFFLKLLEKIPELEAGAFVMIAIIGLKMFALSLIEEFADFHMSHTIESGILFGSIIIVFGGTYLIHKKKQNKQNNA